MNIEKKYFFYNNTMRMSTKNNIYIKWVKYFYNKYKEKDILYNNMNIGNEIFLVVVSVSIFFSVSSFFC